MGFHRCGNCNNEDNDYYCTKIIDGDEFIFYYLEHELNKLPIKERECYWSCIWLLRIRYIQLESWI